MRARVTVLNDIRSINQFTKNYSFGIKSLFFLIGDISNDVTLDGVSLVCGDVSRHFNARKISEEEVSKSTLPTVSTVFAHCRVYAIHRDL